MQSCQAGLVILANFSLSSLLYLIFSLPFLVGIIHFYNSSHFLLWVQFESRSKTNFSSLMSETVLLTWYELSRIQQSESRDSNLYHFWTVSIIDTVHMDPGRCSQYFLITRITCLARPWSHSFLIIIRENYRLWILNCLIVVIQGMIIGVLAFTWFVPNYLKL